MARRRRFHIHKPSSTGGPPMGDLDKLAEIEKAFGKRVPWEDAPSAPPPPKPKR